MTVRTAVAAAVALAALAAAPMAANAAGASPADVVNRHMANTAKGDIDAMMADYADDAVVLTAGKATPGKAAIRGMFEGMLGPKATSKAVIKATKVWEEGDVGFVTWEMNAGTPQAATGGDEFLVRNGKIEVQAVFFGGAPAK